MKFVTEIYRATGDFPKDEIYGLTAQMRRAAVSIPSNLAEGHGRNSRREFRQFIGQARGSLTELDTQLEIASNLGYLLQTMPLNCFLNRQRLGECLLVFESGRKLTPDY